MSSLEKKKKSIQVLCPFLNGLFVFFQSSCMNSLVWDINPLTDTCFANIFSHCIGCLFIFFFLNESFNVYFWFSLVYLVFFFFFFFFFGFFFFFFFFFFCHTGSMWKFLGQALNLCHTAAIRATEVRNTEVSTC